MKKIWIVAYATCDGTCDINISSSNTKAFTSKEEAMAYFKKVKANINETAEDTGDEYETYRDDDTDYSLANTDYDGDGMNVKVIETEIQL